MRRRVQTFDWHCNKEENCWFRALSVTSVQDDVVDHVALVLGVVEAERAAQVPGRLLRGAGRVARLHVHGEGVPEDTRGGRETDAGERWMTMWLCGG